jgi:hypothetical protein
LLPIEPPDKINWMRAKEAKSECHFRVRWDAKGEGYIATNDNDDVLAVDRVLDNAIHRAVREAKLASHAGYRSKVFVENKDGIFKRECIVEPFVSLAACS